MRPSLGAARPAGWSEPGRTTREITTGGWRTKRPVWIEATAPCRAACPAGEPIARWIERARAWDWAAAWSLIREENPFPAVMGRVCAHPCESACNRGAWDGAVAINALERFVGDWGLARGTVTPPMRTRQERVAVCGGGPAGLTCAYHLARLGYRVTIFEAEAELGGVLRYGIPQYRLPRPVLDREIERILALGITVGPRRRLTAGAWAALESAVRAAGRRGAGAPPSEASGPGEWDAVFLATGAGIPVGLDVPGARARGVGDGLALLRDVSQGERPPLGGRVVVVGGGSTAMDVARTARRLGAASVTVLALETRETMPAVAEEIAQALAEGVEIVNAVGVQAFIEADGRVAGATVAPAHLGRDASGAIVPVFDPGPETVVAADAVLLAIGQRPDLSALPPGLAAAGGIVAAGPAGATAVARVFAGGDLASRERTVAHAIGAGARAARAIHAALSGATTGLWEEPPAWASARPGHVVAPGRIATHAFAPAPRATTWERQPSARVGSFVEVVEGLDEHTTRDETLRCFTCGHCVSCDVCLTVCPDMAIVREANPGYALASEHCKGCGLCARECPRGALDMDVEPFSGPEMAR